MELGEHRRNHLVAETRVEARILDRPLHAIEREPLLVEAVQRRLRPGIGEHASRLCLDLRLGPELASGSRCEQDVVGHRTPQEVGQPRRDLVITEPDLPILLRWRTAELPAVQKAWRLQHRLDEHLDRAVKVEQELRTRGVVERDELLDLARCERAPKDAPAEACDELLGALDLAKARRVAGK